MNLETFKAPTMAEALAKVKRAFGPEAVILHTRTLNEGGVLGYGQKRQVEITAAKDSFSLPRGHAKTTVPRKLETAGVRNGAANVTRVTDNPMSSATFAALARQVASLDSAVTELLSDVRNSHLPQLPSELQEVYRDLVGQQVAKDTAARLVRRITTEGGTTPQHVRKQLADYVRSMLPVAESLEIATADKPAVLAFVGPTGVGKTTTIAKLAAHQRLRREHKVGLMTTDTHRIAAHEQLRTYADIIDVPFHVAASPDHVRSAIHAMNQCDLILIDTAGISPKNAQKRDELKTLLEAAGPSEVHLVLAATTGADALKLSIDRFNVLGVNRMIFTKLDEAVGFGVILNCLQQTEAKLSFVTNGQRVPDDIQTGRMSRIAESIAGQDPADTEQRETSAMG